MALGAKKGSILGQNCLSVTRAISAGERMRARRSAGWLRQGGKVASAEMGPGGGLVRVDAQARPFQHCRVSFLHQRFGNAVNQRVVPRQVQIVVLQDEGIRDARCNVRQTPESVPARKLSLLAANDQTRAPVAILVLSDVQVAPLSTERQTPLLSVPARSRSLATRKSFTRVRPELSAAQLVPLFLKRKLRSG